jgi:hypothetical protein
VATASDLLSVIASRFDGAANRAIVLDMAESRTSSTHYGPNREQAVALRAAHILVSDESANSTDGSSLGPIASKGEGDLSVSYGQVGGGVNADMDLAATGYGRQLISLRRASGTGVRVSGFPFVSGSF